MNVKISSSWKMLLQREFEKNYFTKLVAFIKEEVKKYTIYPPGSLIFNAFAYCSFEEVKVIIIGQDPYHGPKQANGLCFSVNDHITFPPSLFNIFKEIQNDLNKPIPISGNLERWAKQGVLLLNATLTVRRGQAGSHQNKGWETFTDTVIFRIAKEKKHLVFILWGSYAQKKETIIDISKHCILKSVHPSPLSANRGFFGNKHFSRANEYLIAHGKTPIDW